MNQCLNNEVDLYFKQVCENKMNRFLVWIDMSDKILQFKEVCLFIIITFVFTWALSSKQTGRSFKSKTIAIQNEEEETRQNGRRGHQRSHRIRSQRTQNLKEIAQSPKELTHPRRWLPYRNLRHGNTMCPRNTITRQSTHQRKRRGLKGDRPPLAERA